MTLQIKLSNHLAVLTSLFIAAVLILACLFLLHFDEDFVFILGIFFLVDAIPAGYLHLEYLLKNINQQFEVRSNEIVFHYKGNSKTYRREDIESITFYMAPSVYRGSNLHFLAMESYNYARILTRSGEELIITCLLAPNVEKAINILAGVSKLRKKRVFCTLVWK